MECCLGKIGQFLSDDIVKGSNLMEQSFQAVADTDADYGSKSWPRTDTVGDNAGARPAPAQGRLDITETGEI